MNYGRDGTPSGHSDADAEAAGGVAKNLQPARIRSHPPAGKSEPFAFDAPAASDAVAPKTPFSAESSSRDAFQPSYAPRPAAAPPLPPTRMEVEDYRRRLELRLLERYNNLPDYAGKVGKVTVVLSKPLQLSLDGTMIRAEFDQLVFDPWGKRLPELEEEYYAVTFGSGGAQQVRADPSIRVGLDLEKTYSERAPLNADPFSRVPDDRAFRSAPAPESAPRAKMPEWWRPE